MAKTYPCYVTGKTLTQSYYFGSPLHALLDLSQEAFAHFIIRAGKDAMHQQIMRDLEHQAAEADAKTLALKATTPNTDAYIDAALEFAMVMDKLSNLYTQKCESGVRILRKMKKEYEQTGKLTS